jgi:hypothetical protein
MLPTIEHFAELVEDLRVVSGFLDSTITLPAPTNDLLVLRRAITELQAAADASALFGAEIGDERAMHNAFACAKELAVLSVQLEWYERLA